jgi:hypothetical protein
MNWAQSNGVQAAYLNFSQMVEQKAQQMNANMSQWLAGDALELYNEIWVFFLSLHPAIFAIL